MKRPGPVPPLGLLATALLAAALAPRAAPAHPAHAEPLPYPYVVGFERFHSGLDDDEHLAEGGMILLGELNCVACHEPPAHAAAQLAGTVATRLDGVAARLPPLELELMIRNPRFVKRDTAMPSLFSGPDRDLDEIEALVHYLSTLDEAPPPYPAGEIQRGRDLYHRIGCIACHAPEADYRPAGLPEFAEIVLTGLPSVPMNLADIYPHDSLVHFLLHPLEHRPSGRMPDFDLGVEEAADLAAYLRAGPDLILTEDLRRALRPDPGFTTDAALAARGRELFRGKNCTACHEPPGGGERTLFRSLPLAELEPGRDAGCLSERPPRGAVPYFGLDEVQRRAVAAALERLAGRASLDAPGEIDWRMKRLNCYACHERAGVGGPETSREVYFALADERAMPLGRWGRLPPPLDGVGGKLRPGALERILRGGSARGGVRPHMEARMPRFREEETAALLRRLPEADAPGGEGGAPRPAAEPPGDGSVEAGARLLGAEGKDCLACHSAGPRRWTESPGVDLAVSARRLRPDWFRELLLEPQSLQPGTPKPDVFPPGAESEAEIEALWSYLRSLGGEGGAEGGGGEIEECGDGQ